MSLGILKGPEPLTGSSDSFILITTTGSADAKISVNSFCQIFWEILCTGVSLGGGFSAIDEKHALKHSAISIV